MSKSISEDIVEKFLTVSRSLKENMEYQSDLVNLSFLQLRAMMFIHRSDGSVQMKDIAEHFVIEMPTATSLVNKLARLKLVSRTVDKKDRRIVRINLSEKGKKVINEAMHTHSRRMEKMLSYLSEDEKHNLLTILKTLVEKLA